MPGECQQHPPELGDELGGRRGKMFVVGQCAGQVKLNLPAGRVLGALALP